MSPIHSASIIGNREELPVNKPRIAVIVNLLLTAALVGAYVFYRYLGN